MKKTVLFVFAVLMMAAAFAQTPMHDMNGFQPNQNRMAKSRTHQATATHAVASKSSYNLTMTSYQMQYYAETNDWYCVLQDGNGNGFAFDIYTDEIVSGTTYTFDQMDDYYSYASLNGDGDEHDYTDAEFTYTLANGVETVVAKAVLDNRDVYNLTYSRTLPVVTDTVDVNIPAATLNDYTSTNGVFQMLGYSADQSWYVTVAIYANQIAGTYSDYNFNSNYTWLAYMMPPDTTYMDFESGNATVTATATGYSLEAYLLCNNNTCYHVTMTYLAPRATDTVEVDIPVATLNDYTSTNSIFQMMGVNTDRNYYATVAIYSNQIEGTYTTSYFNPNYTWLAYMTSSDTTYMDFESGNATVTATATGYSLDAYLLCDNNTCYHVTMTYTAPTMEDAIDTIDIDIPEAALNDFISSMGLFQFYGYTADGTSAAGLTIFSEQIPGSYAYENFYDDYTYVYDNGAIVALVNGNASVTATNAGYIVDAYLLGENRHCYHVTFTYVCKVLVEETQEACGSYTWSLNGETYTETPAVAPTEISINEERCMVVTTLHLTITHKQSNHEYVTNCGPYTWQISGKTYNKGGNKTYKRTVSEGCTEYDTLTLTVVDRWSNHDSVTNCGPYTWDANGKTYSKSGVKICKHTAEDGCPVYDTLTLTVAQGRTSHEYVTNCGPYTWAVNGQTYNKSGVKYYKGTTLEGCPVRDTLTLTVNPAGRTSHEYVTNCGPYTWAVTGVTYNKSGVKYYKSTTPEGCPIRDTLTLTVNPVGRTSHEYVTNCGPYTWSVNGQTYNKSGVKYYKSTTPEGCPIRDTLTLVVNPAGRASHEYVTNCGPYTWAVNGKTYNKGGVKTYKSYTEEGCPNYDTLTLVVNPAGRASHEYVTNCGPYTWAVNGKTYNKGGVKTYKSYTEEGCPNYDTLELTIVNCDKSPDVSSQLSIFNSQLSIYPNPTTGLVRIDFEAGSDNGFNSTVEVFDLVGRRVALFENSNTIDLSGLANGTYTLRITMLDGVAVRKVVKK